MVPNPWDPVDDLNQLQAARSAADLHLDQLPPQVAAEEAFHWLHVIGTQHPPDHRPHRYVQTLGKNKVQLHLQGQNSSGRESGRRISASPEVVVKLEVGGRRCGLAHSADNVRTENKGKKPGLRHQCFTV